MKITFNTKNKIDDETCKQIGYFNQLLVRDTKLFVDPFLVKERQDTVREFSNSYEKIVKFFQRAFEIAAKTKREENSVLQNKLKNMLIFPEENGFKLGYAKSIYGSGGGGALSGSIINQIYDTIEMSETIPEHFEQLSLFVMGIGSDTISDIVLNILKENFIEYTQRICQDLKIEMQEITIYHYKFDLDNLRWIDKKVLLPINCLANQPIILVPKAFLKHLPTLNRSDFSEFIWQKYNKDLREDFSYDIKSKLDNKAIIKIAFERREWVKEYIQQEEKKEHFEYDIETDLQGLTVCGTKVFQDIIDKEAQELRKILNNRENFNSSVVEILKLFKGYIEDVDGLSLLWNKEGKHQSESVLQGIFECYLYLLKTILNWDITREGKASNGAFDFKISEGNNTKMIIEVKNIDHKDFIDGYKIQLPRYLKAERTTNGVFMCIAYSDEDVVKFNKEMSSLDMNSQYNIEIIMIDARKKPSPSKDKKTE